MWRRAPRALVAGKRQHRSRSRGRAAASGAPRPPAHLAPRGRRADGVRPRRQPPTRRPPACRPPIVEARSPARRTRPRRERQPRTLVYAATSVVDARRGSAVLVLTESSSLDLGPTVRWFLLAVGGHGPARRAGRRPLSKRLTQPLREADVATQRIAAGDLSARVPVPQGDDELADLARSINSMAGRARPSRRASSSSSCCRSRTTCARRSPRSAATPRRSPTAPTPRPRWPRRR